MNNTTKVTDLRKGRIHGTIYSVVGYNIILPPFYYILLLVLIFIVVFTMNKKYRAGSVVSDSYT